MSRYGNPFRYVAPNGPGGSDTGQNLNLADSESAANFASYAGISMWTTGAALVDTVTLPMRGIGSTWRVYSVSFSASLLMVVPNQQTAAGPVQVYGKLAPLRGGVSLQGPQTQGQGSIPWVFLSQSLLPRDSSLIGSLWDPSSDPLPPMYYDNQTPLAPTQMLDIAGGVTPPMPLDVPAGGNLYVGMWLEPALLACQVVGGIGLLSQALQVFNGQYEIYFDELGSQQGPINY